MEIINITFSVIAENGMKAAFVGIGAVIVGPPVTKRLVGLTREFWDPKITRLRRTIADRVAPADPTDGANG
ncbi:hypothetical protein ACFYM0_33755 [Streptomyces sp. NPDC006487]|uniref:hypothetical protein n=1 Tax=Streptomyces sp. NPDC006487 TaxID=3364748 RepID=UPI003677B1F8